MAGRSPWRPRRVVAAAPQVALCTPFYSATAPATRALLPLAAACGEGGLAPRIYAGVWRGAAPEGLALTRLGVAYPAAARGRRFPRCLARALRRRPADCVVGFGGLQGVDIGFGCGALAVGTRSVPLPPGLAMAPAAPAVRSAAEVVLAMVGDDLAAQGVERLLVALDRLSSSARRRCRVVLRGRLAPRFLKAAAVLGLADRVAAAMEVDPGPALAAADVAVDLSFRAAANPWLFDAMAAGAAVLTHDALAEAPLVRAAASGVVLPTPYKPADCADALRRLVEDEPQRLAWQRNAAQFAAAPSRNGQLALAMAAIDCRLRGNARADAAPSA